MSQTAEKEEVKMYTPQEIVESAKGEYTRAHERIKKALNTTAEDKLNWSPSSTCRTPIQQVAHAALSVNGIQGMFQGKPFPFSDVVEADRKFREMEKEYGTKQQVLDLLDKNGKEYLAFLDTLTPDQVRSNVSMGFGEFPMASAITFPADHLRAHAAQIDYMQTIYGDMDWHM